MRQKHYVHNQLGVLRLFAGKITDTLRFYPVLKLLLNIFFIQSYSVLQILYFGDDFIILFIYFVYLFATKPNK